MKDVNRKRVLITLDHLLKGKDVKIGDYLYRIGLYQKVASPDIFIVKEGETGREVLICPRMSLQEFITICSGNQLKEDNTFGTPDLIYTFCEWDPKRNRPSQYKETYYPYDVKIFRYWGCQNRAELILGYNGKWRLCESCSKLPYFSRYKRRCRIQHTSNRA